MGRAKLLYKEIYVNITKTMTCSFVSINELGVGVNVDFETVLTS